MRHFCEKEFKKYMEFYCDFRNYAEIFIIQGLATSDKFISKYPIALIKFNNYLEYKKVNRIDIDFFQSLENEYNIKHNIKDLDTYFQELRETNHKLTLELLSYNNHNLLIPNENDNGKRIKDCVSNFKKHIINDLKDKYMFKIDNRLLYKVDDIILNENNFILFSREETKTSTLYNTLKSISKSDLIIRYNLGTKNLKKDYINDLIEKSIEKEIITYVKELRRDILYLINKSTMEITQGNLDFLLDDYSNSLNIPFYEYVLKYIYNK